MQKPGQDFWELLREPKGLNIHWWRELFSKDCSHHVSVLFRLGVTDKKKALACFGMVFMTERWTNRAMYAVMKV